MQILLGTFIWPDTFDGLEVCCFGVLIWIPLCPAILLLNPGTEILLAAIAQVDVIAAVQVWFIRRKRRKGWWDILDTLACVGVYVLSNVVTNLLFILFTYLTY